MSGVHLHLLVNHVPIIGAFFALALLLASFRFAGDVLRRTALVVLVGVAVFGGAAKLTGDPAEDGVRGMPGVTRAAIHEHEDMADKGFIAAVIMGVVAIGILVRSRQSPISPTLTMVSSAGTAVVAGLMAYAGLLGGRVRHTEVRPGATAADAIAIEAPRVRRPPPGEPSAQPQTPP